MDTHSIGTDTFAIFGKSEKGGLLTLQFIWGKKDFRVFLERKHPNALVKGNQAVLRSKKGEYILTRLQYLYEFEWYDFDKVSGHGLAHDEVRWKKDGTVRYVELPQHFYEIVARLASLEFGLTRKGATAQAV